jgi:hypothetical protein
MTLLSNESARVQYDKLYDYHNDNRDLVKKVRDFWHDLEHYILKEITKRQSFYDVYDDINKPRWKRKIIEKGQLSWLKENNIQITLVSNIQNFKVHRNDAEHNNTMDSITYCHLLSTMVRAIQHFSEEPIPEKIENILNSCSQVNSTKINCKKELGNDLHIHPVILNRVKRQIENDLNIMEGTIPIVYFGNYNSAKACTVSINPSQREFLHGNEKRMCLRKEFKKKDSEELTLENAQTILEYCNSYFKRKNPNPWFNELECFIKFFDYSYYNDSCVHLNLVQWCTTPIWSKIKDKNVKSEHLFNDIDVLETLLKNKNFEYIYLNGITVVSEFEKCFNTIKLDKKKETYRNKNVELYIGSHENTKILGWNLFLGKPPIRNEKDIKEFHELINNSLP